MAGESVLVKTPELIRLLTFAKEIAFIQLRLRCARRTFWIQKIAATLRAHRSRIRLIAHRACSAINGSRSFPARPSAGKSDSLPTLPSATQTFRKNPRRLIRLIGE